MCAVNELRPSCGKHTKCGRVPHGIIAENLYAEREIDE